MCRCKLKILVRIFSRKILFSRKFSKNGNYDSLIAFSSKSSLLFGENFYLKFLESAYQVLFSFLKFRYILSIEKKLIKIIYVCSNFQVDLRHLLQQEGMNEIEVGIDLADYYISVEWDILRVLAVRNEKFYSCCEEPYPDIMFYLTLRRKTLFYVVNLIIPCVGISFLSVLVFYLPSESREKVSLAISILLSLTVFFLLLVEIIPPTSITVPLLGKYLIFTMILVSLSVVVTIFVLNINFRSPVTHKMPKWVKIVFIKTLPKYLMIERPPKDSDNPDHDDDDYDDGGCKPPDDVLTDDACFHVEENDNKYDPYDSGGAGPEGVDDNNRYSAEYEIPNLPPSVSLRYEQAAGIQPCFGDEPMPALPLPGTDDDLYGPTSPSQCYARNDISPTFDRPLAREIERTVEDARFIAQHAKNKDKYENVSYFFDISLFSLFSPKYFHFQEINQG